jgi:hypothetical protein
MALFHITRRLDTVGRTPGRVDRLREFQGRSPSARRPRQQVWCVSGDLVRDDERARWRTSGTAANVAAAETAEANKTDETQVGQKAITPEALSLCIAS